MGGIRAPRDWLQRQKRAFVQKVFLINILTALSALILSIHIFRGIK